MNPTILLVDSDLSNRTDWQAVFEEQGYRVFAAGSAVAALDECADLQPDLVLLQTSLPDMQGLELCRRLKDDSRNRTTPIVLMAPYSHGFGLSEARKAGADDFWDRPSSYWELFNRVQSIIQMKSCIDRQAESVVLSLARAIEARDIYTEHHSERLSAYAAELGKLLKLRDDDLEALHIAGLLHDVGKVAVPDSILLKPGRLTSEEMAVMQQHPLVGENICSPVRSFRKVLPIIRSHHEKMDGTGYPDGLVGRAIPLTARILHVVDVYDALVTDRPYRKALTRSAAMAVLIEEAARGWLDQSVVNQFVNQLTRSHADVSLQQ
jgi:putative two-component system response regulator